MSNKEQELNSSIALINFLIRMGYLEMASQLLENTDCSGFSGDESRVLKLKLKLAESNLMLQKGKVSVNILFFSIDSTLVKYPNLYIAIVKKNKTN